MIDAVAIGRSAGDILSRTLRLTLGGVEYELPVLPIAGNRRWMAQLNDQLRAVLGALRGAGIDSPSLYEALSGQVDQMLDLIVSYDVTHVLPSRDEIMEATYEPELLAAIQEVWLAANPLVAIALARLRMGAAGTNGTSPPTSSSPPPTAGRRRRSKTN